MAHGLPQSWGPAKIEEVLTKTGFETVHSLWPPRVRGQGWPFQATPGVAAKEWEVTRKPVRTNVFKRSVRRAESTDGERINTERWAWSAADRVWQEDAKNAHKEATTAKQTRTRTRRERAEAEVIQKGTLRRKQRKQKRRI